MHTILFVFCIFIFSGIWRRKITLLRYRDIVPNKARSLSGAEENILWESGQLDYNSSRSLIRTVWCNNCLHFGMRGEEEHHSLKIEQFRLEIDENGRRYISYTEVLSETRNKGLNFKPGLISPKMYENKHRKMSSGIFLIV